METDSLVLTLPKPKKTSSFFLSVYLLNLKYFPGDFAILFNVGMSYKMTMAFNFLSACVCYLGLITALIMGTKTSAVSGSIRLPKECPTV